MHALIFSSSLGGTFTALQSGATGGGGSGVGGDAVAAGTAQAAALDLTTVIVAVFAAVVIMVVLFPIARAVAKRMEKGGAKDAAIDPGATARLERLEQSVEAMSLEIERISEGQRYTTKLLTERLPLAVKVPLPGQSDKTLL